MNKVKLTIEFETEAKTPLELEPNLTDFNVAITPLLSKILKIRSSFTKIKIEDSFGVEIFPADIDADDYKKMVLGSKYGEKFLLESWDA